jgi:hypothetical protein
MLELAAKAKCRKLKTENIIKTQRKDKRGEE